LIADMHRNPATFAKRFVSGNTVLIAKAGKGPDSCGYVGVQVEAGRRRSLRKLIGAADAE
jgi:hypothetical protein